MGAQVALSKDFMEAYARLPRKLQKKVREFTEKFQRDPKHPGINYEKLEGARDDKVRSVRIDQDYRAIVVHPPQGDVYLCVWVDHHDEAYRWAQKKQFEVNPRSGSFQLFEVVEASAPPVEQVAEAPVVEAVAGLFDHLDDEDLLLAGTPTPLLAAVRALATEEDLDRLAPHLPGDAAEMLYLLAAGYDLLEAMEEAERSSEPESVDVTDFETALARPDSGQQFKIVENENELEEMLDAPFDQWRIFLHPTQRKLVQMNANGPVRVLGGAGTGKTVVLMHRANHLLKSVFTGPDDRILVTTFTRNLALDLASNLHNLCGSDCDRLEVMNLHSWAVGFMRRQGHSFKIISESDRSRKFEEAIAETAADEYSPTFYKDEWDQVVQAQNIDSRDAYFTARRVGRGVRLGRKQKARVWVVFEKYRELLEEDRQMEWEDVIRETKLFIEKQGVRTPYRAVLADEVQDFTTNDLRLLRTIAPDATNSLFVVGDAHQRIYGHVTTLGSCGIEIRGRSRRLKLNYRTTAQIRERAVSLLEGRDIDDLDGGLDSLKGYYSLRQGPVPDIRMFPSEAKEAERVVGQIKEWLATAPAETICLAARTHALLKDRYLQILDSANIPTVLVETDPQAEAELPGVRLATMHRMKGLEFSRVLLAGVHKGSVPLETSRIHDSDEIERQEWELQERCLLYVAGTRARDELVITGFGEASPFLT